MEKIRKQDRRKEKIKTEKTAEGRQLERRKNKGARQKKRPGKKKKTTAERKKS